MNLTGDQWLKVILAVGTLILTGVGHVVIWQWHQPDVRYQEGSWYRSTALSVAGISMTNLGGSAAEDVTVTASFAEPLIDVATGGMGIHLDILAGGIGEKGVTAVVKRLVPKETVFLYFVTKPLSPWIDQGSFVRGIKFNGGQGKTGIPGLYMLPGILLVIVLAGVMYISLSYLDQWKRRKYDDQLREAIQLGLFAAQEGLSEEQLRAKVEERHLKVRWYIGKQRMMTVALTAFTGIRQTPM